MNQRYLWALTVSLLLCGFLPAESAPLATALTNPGPQASTADRADIPLAENKDNVRLTIQVAVQQNRRSSNQFTVYPYPVEPPSGHPKLTIGILSTKDKDLKNSLLVLGYVSRVKKPLPYPTSGYRMNYAYQRALGRYGGGVPHTISELYRWIDEMLPYFKEEVLKSNEDQRTRSDRLQACKTFFYAERADIETEALKQGLSPLDVHVSSWEGVGQQGEIMLPKGHWWIVGTHKLPGLSFYWQEPVDLTEGGKTVKLNDGNALIIEGAW